MIAQPPQSRTGNATHSDGGATNIMAKWSELLRTAQSEVEKTLSELPVALRSAASELPVVYERIPSEVLIADGLDPDLLGLFVGSPVGDETQAAGIPAQVLLFLENLWEFAEEDPDIYVEEIRTTYLHELGHYLGLDEDELEARGLE